MGYKEKQRKLQVQKLLYKYPDLFNHDKGGAPFDKYESLIFVLQDGENNLYQRIRLDAVNYFKENNIAWWGDNKLIPSGHLLSSQIQCLNFLFALKKDREAVLKIASLIDENIDDVLLVSGDKEPSYLAFEFIYENKTLLNETDYGAQRGAFCTSVDAFILAKKGEKKILIPIEWKYTEVYPEMENKAKEHGKGETRQKRYNQLIEESKQLKTVSDLEHSLYYYEPFYEFMRQTLLVEQMVIQNIADEFIHVVVIPEDNKELMGANYNFTEHDLENSWRSMLEKQNMFKIIDSKDILQCISAMERYSELADYLSKRYFS